MSSGEHEALGQEAASLACSGMGLLAVWAATVFHTLCHVHAGRAMEMFLEKLCTQAINVAQSRQAKTLNPSHL